jgi:multidrug efflux pump subunit AcrB
VRAWINFSMRNAGVIFLAMLLILGGGLYAKSSMKMEEMPNIDIPFLSVVIVYPGAIPEQVLDDVGKPVEAALSGLKGLKNMYVAAGNDYAAITMEFDLSKSMDEAQKDINSALATVKLPEGAQKPRISSQGPNAAPVYSFGISGGEDQASVQEYVNQKIKPAFASISGISSIDVKGTGEKKLFIKIDPAKLKDNNLTVAVVKQMLQANNIAIPAGSLTLDDKDLNVEVRKKVGSLDEIKNIELVAIDQNMSGLTDAFKAIGSGMGTVGSSLGKIGQGVGNLTKGQMLLQGQIQLVQGISGLTTKIATNQLALASLQQQLQGVEDLPEPKKTATKEAIQAQIKTANDSITADSHLLKGLQSQLAGLQSQVQASGTDTANTLQGLAGSKAPAKPKDNVSMKPELTINTIKLSEVADVSYTTGKDRVITRLNGKPAVVTDITAQPGTNVVDMVKELNDKLDSLKLPQGYQLTKLRDTSIQVKKSVDSMQREAILGALFAMLITFVFLRNWRSTIVAILSIPLSIFASIITLYLLDYSLNIMTLAGIAVAVGRVVDDSIVVIENIYRRVRSTDIRGPELVLEAAKEVGQAVTSSTITTVAVFAPLMFVPGIVGKFFKPFGITVVVSILFSLLVALTVVPLLSKLFLLNMEHHEDKESVLQKGYRKMLEWSLNHRVVVSIIAMALVGGSIALATIIPQNFLPSEKSVSYGLRVEMPVGTAIVKTDEVAGKIEQALSTRNEVKSYQTHVQGEGLTINIELKDSVNMEDSKAFEKEVQKFTSDLGPNVTTALTPLSISSGYSGLFLVLKGSEPQALKEAGDMIIAKIKDTPGLADVKTNLSAVKPQVSIDIDPAVAAKKALNPAMVALAVRQMIDGDNIMDVVLDGRTTPVNLGLKVDSLTTLDTIKNQTITNMTGDEIKLSDVATVAVKPGPTSIQRLNQQEYVSINGRFTTDNSSAVQKEVEKRINELTLPAGVTYYSEGESKAMSDGFKNLGMAMALAVLLVYMVMLVAFGEMLAPLAILFSLPFIFVGGLGGLYLSGDSLGVPAMVGFLMLIGIVVTNAIVYMDRVLHNRSNGLKIQEALIEAGATRLRPILMTAIATICALLPLAISSEGGLISRSLAIVVISGLTTSTVLTLVIVPVAYEVLDAIRGKIMRSSANVKF